MNNMAPQFTPAQILDAARRAEGEGRVDYALKFYRHLAEHFAHTQEGAVAADAINRLVSPRLGEPSPPPQFGGGGRFDIPAQGPPAGDGRFQGPPPDERKVRTGGRSQRQRRRAEGIPEPSRGYLFGRAMALLATWGGVLLTLLGLGIVGAGIGNVTVVADLLGGIPGFDGLRTAFLMTIGGIVLIFAGQLAQAVFSIANSVREIADIQQFRLEQDEDTERDGRWR